MFGSRLGFTGSADRMALFAVRYNPRWWLTAWPTWIYNNNNIFATGLPIDVMFVSRVGFPAELSFRGALIHTRTAVARNPCVSWAFLLSIDIN